MKRLSVLVFALAGMIFLALPVTTNSSVTAGRVEFSFNSPDVDVTLYGDMNDMEGETMLWSDDDGYFYLDYTLQKGEYEYYVTRGGDAVNIMFYIEEDIEPKPDYYVDDGYSGLNAVIILDSKTDVRFTYTPPDVWDCFDPELDNDSDSDDVSVIIVAPGMDNKEYKLDFIASEDRYSKMIKLTSGYCEFYYSLAGDAINNMRKYDGMFEPAQDGYVDDGYGGFNAIVKVD